MDECYSVEVAVQVVPKSIAPSIFPPTTPACPTLPHAPLRSDLEITKGQQRKKLRCKEFLGVSGGNEPLGDKIGLHHFGLE